MNSRPLASKEIRYSGRIQALENYGAIQWVSLEHW
jgi:hypothetical protein